MSKEIFFCFFFSLLYWFSFVVISRVLIFNKLLVCCFNIRTAKTAIILFLRILYNLSGITVLFTLLKNKNIIYIGFRPTLLLLFGLVLLLIFCLLAFNTSFKLEMLFKNLFYPVEILPQLISLNFYVPNTSELHDWNEFEIFGSTFFLVPLCSS